MIINFLAFQILWLLCVFGAAYGYPWAGPVAVAGWLLVHLKLHQSTARQELQLAIFTAVLGYGLDSMLVLFDIIHFPEQAQLGYPSALWMVALWVNLAMTIRHSLDWLNHHYVWIGLFGGIGGAMAYWAGKRIGSITMEDTMLSLTVIFSVWFLALAVIYAVSNKLKQRASQNIGQFNEAINEGNSNV